jgi:uncharacterized RDD family membrane protein YckC
MVLRSEDSLMPAPPQDSCAWGAEARSIMERTIEVTTGESVAFSYELAGLGSRFLAVFIDLAIQIAIAVGALFLLLWISSSIPARVYVGVPVANGLPYKIAFAIVVSLFIFAAFLIFFGYFIVFETLWNGRTPGKRLVGIRVVRDGGFPVDFSSALIRNVVRVLEAGLGFYAISAICALASPQNRRLGDMAAGTIVVRDRAFEGGAPVAAIARDDPLVRDLGAEERELVRRYVQRRASLADGPRRALAFKIAEVVRPKLTASFDHLDDDSLLVHIAQTALS